MGVSFHKWAFNWLINGRGPWLLDFLGVSTIRIQKAEFPLSCSCAWQLDPWNRSDPWHEGIQEAGRIHKHPRKRKRTRNDAIVTEGKLTNGIQHDSIKLSTWVISIWKRLNIDEIRTLVIFNMIQSNVRQHVWNHELHHETSGSQAAWAIRTLQKPSAAQDSEIRRGYTKRVSRSSNHPFQCGNNIRYGIIMDNITLT